MGYDREGEDVVGVIVISTIATTNTQKYPTHTQTGLRLSWIRIECNRKI